MYRISSIIISTVFVIFFAGCDYLDGHKDEGMAIYTASLVSISDDRPAEVVIGAYGEHPNTCVNPEAKVYANLDGNKIYLTAKKEIPIGPGGCGDAVSDVYGEATVKNLEVGEYILIVDNFSPKYSGTYENEIGRFRIESDAAYMNIKPAEIYAKRPEPLTPLNVILSPRVPEYGELEDAAYHVKIVVDIVGFGIDREYSSDLKKPGCEPIYKTDIERTEDVINLEIWRLVPHAGSRCTLEEIDLRRLSIFYPSTIKAEIDIGTFSAGSYTVSIKGEKFYFDVPQPID